MAQLPERLTDPGLLLVEGREEVLFLGALRECLGLSGLEILDTGGKTNYPAFLRAIRRHPDFPALAALGLLRDADLDAAGALQSLAGALEAAGLPAPREPLVPAGEGPRVVVMIMPGGGRPGMLEDLCLEAVRDEPATACVEDFFACLRGKGLPLPDNMSKARVQTYLSAQEKPGLRLGEAACKQYWPWSHPAFAEVKRFLRLLCP